MRTKTSARPSSNIPVKRTSEGVETSRASKSVSESSESSADVVVPNPVFPVKSVLKKSDQQEQVVDKENINPLTAYPVVDWDDLDAEDAGDPLMVSDYVVEIFEYMNQLEVILNYVNNP